MFRTRALAVASSVLAPGDLERQTEEKRSVLPTCKVYRNGQSSHGVAHLSEISEVLKEEGSLVWLDVVDPGPNDLKLLQAEFDLHPLAVEDAMHAHERPKIESYDSYWFLVVQGTTLSEDNIIFHEIAIFAGTNFLVTVRHSPVYGLEEIEKRWHAHPEELKRGAGFLLYTILDTVVDGYLPVSQTFQDRVDELEEALFAGRSQDAEVLPRVFGMKKDAQRFRWAVLPMRDILNPIIRQDLELVGREDLAYFRDVYDHAVLVIDQLDTLRDLVNSALEIHLSVVANRQNDVSKQLTVIATIFLPLTFVTGFFGQNFAFLVGHIGGTDAFIGWGLGTELLTIGLTLGYFKWKGWF
ncbi:MAG TPA: magnesium and cobalt transport protein CorA [Chloroflexi bacterium]|nr:magnesium and cobalt transport protein CorA [Chloroflexota bacterium]